MEGVSAIDRLCVDTVRMLAIDAVEKAKSGHPGTPMALAPLAFTLYRDILRHDPATPHFPNRDRFVLSCGHASMLLYGVLHLCGYDVTLDDIKRFRQIEGRCAGHPEYGLLPGIETTTGPLGQGAANSVGMAIAQRWLAAYFNRPGHTLVDYNVYVMVSDGDIMEGVASEAASIAGHLKLGNLIWIYDSNRITIDGSTRMTLSEDVSRRFAAYGWWTGKIPDANDIGGIGESVRGAFRDGEGRPKFLEMTSHIAYGSPGKQDTAAAHGAPLGPEEVRATKQFYGWDPNREFYVPPEAKSHLTEWCRDRGTRLVEEWNSHFAAYEMAHPELAEQWKLLQSGKLPQGWERDLPCFNADGKPIATRSASGKTLAKIASQVPWLIGGSADLAESTQTFLPGEGDFGLPDFAARNIRFGVREHAMCGIANGLALSKLHPFVGTFFIFSDYARPSIRLAALMGLPVIYVFTHDSIGLGEDGPTHQPVEHLMSLRAMPNHDVVRPCDANETVVAWEYAMSVGDHPVALILTRQAVPILKETGAGKARGLLRGGYVLRDTSGTPDVILIGTGSEVQLCLGAAERLVQEGVAARVVSFPCWELFERQDEDYRNTVLPPAVTARVAVEAGVSLGWERYVGRHGAMISMESFGASAPASDLFGHFGFTVDRVMEAARSQVARMSVA